VKALESIFRKSNVYSKYVSDFSFPPTSFGDSGSVASVRNGFDSRRKFLDRLDAKRFWNDWAAVPVKYAARSR